MSWEIFQCISFVELLSQCSVQFVATKTQRFCLKTHRNVVVIYFGKLEQMLLLNHTEIADSKIALSPLVTMYLIELIELPPFSHEYISNVLSLWRWLKLNNHIPECLLQPLASWLPLARLPWTIFQATVVKTLGSAIQLLNHYPWIRKTNCVIHWIAIYPVDNVIYLLNNWGQLHWHGNVHFLNSVLFRVNTSIEKIRMKRTRRLNINTTIIRKKVFCVKRT